MRIELVPLCDAIVTLTPPEQVCASMVMTEPTFNEDGQLCYAMHEAL